MNGSESMPHTHGAHTGDLNVGDGSHAHVARGDGLAASLDGFTLDALEIAEIPMGSRLMFRIIGTSGAPHLQYALDEGKLLHLYVVSEDLATFEHVHPVIDATGSWSVDLPRLAPGAYHVVATFAAITPDSSEHALALGGDVLVEGPPRRPQPLPAEVRTATVDGFRVTLTGDLAVAQTITMHVTVTRRNRPAELVPYLSSWVHMSAWNEGSRAFSHLHATAPASDGAEAPAVIELEATPPAPGRYRIFVEFASESGLHRVSFTRRAWG